MMYATFAPARPVTAIPLREWLPWAIFAGLILLLAIYLWAQSKVPLPSSVGRMCMSSSTTAATFSAFPATD